MSPARHVKRASAAQPDVAARLGWLEETVLTPAEALRPAGPQIPAPRQGSRI